MQPGDVLLVEGNQRISSAIKYLTQSTWSHAAYFVGRDAGLRDKHGHPAALIEADLTDGVIAASLTKYLGYNTRICRPALITEEDRAIVSDYIIKSIGQSYDVKNVVADNGAVFFSNQRGPTNARIVAQILGQRSGNDTIGQIGLDQSGGVAVLVSQTGIAANKIGGMRPS